MTTATACGTVYAMDRDDATAFPPPAVIRPVHQSVVRSIASLRDSGLSPDEIVLKLNLPLFTVRAVLESPLSKALAAQEAER